MLPTYHGTYGHPGLCFEDCARSRAHTFSRHCDPWRPVRGDIRHRQLSAWARVLSPSLDRDDGCHGANRRRFRASTSAETSAWNAPPHVPRAEPVSGYAQQSTRRGPKAPPNIALSAVRRSRCSHRPLSASVSCLGDMKILARIFAWLLLLGSAVVSSVGAIWVDSSGQSQSLLLVTRGSGSLANWLFFFLTLSLSSCVYLLRGIEARVWSIGLHGVVMVGACHDTAYNWSCRVGWLCRSRHDCREAVG